MDFNKAITWSGKIYNLLKKFNLEDYFVVDSLIDNNFPEYVSKLQTYSSVAKIAVTSTNGKKTTVDLIKQILSSNNQTFISNIDKNARKYPFLTSIVLDLMKREEFDDDYKKDYYVMAFDEIEVAEYFNSMKFDYFLLNNLFNEQTNPLNLQEKKQKIQDAIILNSNCTLIINADEPMFYNIDELKNDIISSKRLNKIYFGFNKIEAPGDESIIQENDITRCPNCGCKLDYDKRFYSHIGKYNCECGFKRPELDISADVKIFANYSFMNVYFKDNKYVFKLPFGNLYNAYNALGAISVAIALGIERKVITNAFENYEPLKARDEQLKHRGKEIKLKIIKNPVSFSEAVRELYFEKRTKLVICLNDEDIDGKDTSWIWNANLNAVSKFENKIYICGTRCDDLALKIKYTGVNPCLMIVDNSINNCIKCCYYDLEENENMMILSSPSALNEIKEILEK